MQILLAVSQVFIPPELRLDSDSLRDAQRVVAFHLALFVWAPVYAIVAAVLGAPICSQVLLWGGAFIIGSLLLLRAGKSPSLCGNSLSFVTWSICTALAVLSGGLRSPIMVWYSCIPVFALILSGSAWGIFWTLASALAITGCVVAPNYGFPLWNELTPFAAQFTGYTGLLAFLSLVYTMAWVFKHLENRTERALHQANRILDLQASTDSLTGIANRRSFDRIFQQEWKRHERTGLPLSVAMMDIDFFKQFNDASGHLAGDICLRAVAQVIQSGLRRPGDFVARFGGEEFAVILPSTNDQDAARLCDEIRCQVKLLKIPNPNSSVSPYLTISVGSSTTTPTQGESHLDFLREADVSLYRAKANGRDQSIHFTAVPLETA